MCFKKTIGYSFSQLQGACRRLPLSPDFNYCRRRGGGGDGVRGGSKLLAKKHKLGNENSRPSSQNNFGFSKIKNEIKIKHKSGIMILFRKRCCRFVDCCVFDFILFEVFVVLGRIKNVI